MRILRVVIATLAAAGIVTAQAPDSMSAAVAFQRGADALRSDKLDDAVMWLKRAVDSNDTKALYHLWLGYAYDKQRERANIFRAPSLASKAKAEFERAVALDSTNVDARVRLANKYLYMPRVAGGSLEKARAQAAVVERLNPYQGDLLDALIASHTGDHGAARSTLSALIAANPDSSLPVLRLADLYVQRHQNDSAIALLEARLARAPSDTLARRALARVR